MTIDSCNFAGKKAIVRVDFNVPLNENGQITDDTRIRGALPTLKKVLADGGALIIMSHMGKPKGKVNPKFSLGQIKDAVAAALDALFLLHLIAQRHKKLLPLLSLAKYFFSRTSVSILKKKASL